MPRKRGQFTPDGYYRMVWPSVQMCFDSVAQGVYNTLSTHSQVKMICCSGATRMNWCKDMLCYSFGKSFI